MKTNKYILVLFISAVFAGGCSKDYLERAPLDDISEIDYWKTPNDLKMYVNNLYFSLGKNGFTMDDGSDNAVWRNGFDTWLSGQVQSTTNGIKGYAKKIREVNYMIDNMEEISDAEANQYKGEAYYIRAWHYFGVLKNVGAAQIIKEALKSDDERLYSLREPRNIVADFILEDLDMAISLLKRKADLKNTGEFQRISSDAALALKARVALFEGTWEKYHNGTPFGVENADFNKFLRQAAEAAKTLMDNYGYTLDDNYKLVFNDITPSGTEIPVREIIFARQFSDLKYGQGNDQFGGQHMRQWPVRTGYTREAVRSYLCTDGLPIGLSPDYVGDQSLADITTNRDPRLAMTILTPGDVWIKSRVNGDTILFTSPFISVDAAGQSEHTGYSSEKFYNYTLDHNNNKTRDAVTIYSRYGEILLIYAEAKAELGEFDQAAADISINVLRSRASVNMPPLMVGTIVTDPDWPDYGSPISAALQEIRRERRVELLGEDFRFDDLRRWRAHTLFVGKNFKGAYFEPLMNAGEGKKVPRDADNYFEPFQVTLPNGYQFDPNRDYLLPFPENEIVLNPELTQNPGWQ